MASPWDRLIEVVSKSMYDLLIVDDEKFIRESLERFIDWEALGFRVLKTCASGNEAIRFLKDAHVDVVFSDVVMDDGNGIELAEWINAYQPGMCVVLLTGYADFESARRAVSLPVVRHMMTKPTQPAEIRHVFSEVLGELLLKDGENTDTRYDPFTEQVIKYMKDHLHEDVMLTNLADEMHFSISYLSKLIKDRTGKNFTELLLYLRIEKAKSLLIASNSSISEIGNLVGYTDAQHFAKVFRRQQGISPNEYRKFKRHTEG